MSYLFNRTRDMLMPMVWGAQTKDVTLNVYIEERFDALIVAGRNDKLNRELGFAIPRAAIVDGSYRDQVVPNIRKLIYMLEYRPEVEEFNPNRPNQDPGTWRTH